MPEEENKKTEPMVDIDTSGPEVEVNLEEKEDTNVENNTKPNDTSEKSDEQLDIQVVEEKQETKTEEIKETEDKKKEELEDYSEGVKKRIAKLTKKWREAERQKEAALEFARGVQNENVNIKSKVNKLEPSYVDAMAGKVISGLQAAQAKLISARANDDIAAEVEAQKEIARLGVEEARVAGMKEQAEAIKTQEVKPSQTLEQAIAPSTNKPDPKAEEWAESNPWFGTDSAMTYSAFDLHKKLTEEEGFDPKTDEYYKEVDRRMRLDFPHKFDKTETREPTKPTQTVASATRKVNNSRGNKTVRLTPSQVTIAKKLGVPLELYAKQLNITKER
jgi:hypothetical protein